MEIKCSFLHRSFLNWMQNVQKLNLPELFHKSLLKILPDFLFDLFKLKLNFDISQYVFEALNILSINVHKTNIWKTNMFSWVFRNFEIQFRHVYKIEKDFNENIWQKLFVFSSFLRFWAFRSQNHEFWWILNVKMFTCFRIFVETFPKIRGKMNLVTFFKSLFCSRNIAKRNKNN